MSEWQATKNNVVSRTKHLLKTGKLSDITFVINDKNGRHEFKAHKVIISMGSPVFEEMFYGEKEPPKEVTLEGVSPTAFAIALRFLYTNRFKVSCHHQLSEVCNLATKYKINPLKSICHIYDEYEMVNELDVCEYYTIAKHQGLCDLLYKCVTIIDKDAEGVLESPSFLDAEIETVLDIVQRPTLNVTSELSIFTAILKWGKHYCNKRNLNCNSSNLRNLLRPLIQHIRVSALSPWDFADIAKSEIIENSEVIKIFYRLLSSTINHSSEISTFSSISTKRVYAGIEEMSLKKSGMLSWLESILTSSTDIKDPKFILKIQVTKGAMFVLGICLSGVEENGITEGKFSAVNENSEDSNEITIFNHTNIITFEYPLYLTVGQRAIVTLTVPGTRSYYPCQFEKDLTTYTTDYLQFTVNIVPPPSKSSVFIIEKLLFRTEMIIYTNDKNCVSK